MAHTRPAHSLAYIGALLALVLTPALASAQAWVPAKGEGAVALEVVSD